MSGKNENHDNQLLAEKWETRNNSSRAKLADHTSQLCNTSFSRLQGQWLNMSEKKLTQMGIVRRLSKEKMVPYVKVQLIRKLVWK